MTSDEIKKVREAAERWRFKRYTGHVHDQLKQSSDDAMIVMDFTISLIGTDGEQPITEEWLREEWGFNSPISRAWGHSGITGTFCFEENGLSWWHVGNRTAHITTRYQFRLLAAALGIKRKGE